MSNEIYKVSAFDYKGKGGNPAGVVLEADLLSEAKMIEIAKEVGYSETAFVMKSDKADFKVRFFTPLEEVDLCGHATVATFNLLRDIGIILPGEFYQETKAGILKLQVYEDYILMEQNLPEYFTTIDRSEILECFVGETVDIFGDTAPQIVSTGLKDIIVPIKDLKTLISLKANFTEMDRISRKYDVVGIHAFCFETYEDNDAHTRNFAPRYGINEESATGTANGALCCYLNKYYSDNFDSDFIIEQGYCMDSKSRILVNLALSETGIKKVYVGGSARGI